MPNPLPYYHLYPNDFDLSRAVLSMTLAEQGLYVRCLNLQWRDGSIPDDPILIARYVSRPVKEVRRAWSAVRACLSLQGTCLVSERLQVERSKALAKVQVGVESAKRRWEANARAFDSDSVSESVSPKGESEGETNPATGFVKSLAGGADGVAAKLYAAHPKKKDRVLVEGEVFKLAQRNEDLREIAFIHSLWCRTTDWTEQNARYCPPLAKWLADEGFEKIPDGFEYEFNEWRKSNNGQKNEAATP